MKPVLKSDLTVSQIKKFIFHANVITSLIVSTIYIYISLLYITIVSNIGANIEALL